MNEADTLPKYVCMVCWQKVDDFHQFHRSVQDAQEVYLKSKIKCEYVECDPFEEMVLDHNESDAAISPPQKQSDNHSDNEFHSEIVHEKVEQCAEIDEDILLEMKQDESEWIGKATFCNDQMH